MSVSFSITEKPMFMGISGGHIYSPSPVDGNIYYNDTNDILYISINSMWMELSTPSAAILARITALEAAVATTPSNLIYTSTNWIYTSTYGTDTATWSESSGDITIIGGVNQTANVFYDTPIFDVGDTLSVLVTGASEVYLSVSTTNRGANTGTQSGIRLNWGYNGTNLMRVRHYNNGTGTTINGHSSFNPSSPLTLYITRETDTTFSCAYDDGTGIKQINTDGSTNKYIITISGVAGKTLYAGVECFNSGTRVFSNLRTTNIGKIGVIGSFDIGAVADPQYADIAVGLRGGGRQPEEGVNRLTTAVNAYNSRSNIDWGIIVGDIIDFDDIDYFTGFPSTTADPTVVAGTRWVDTDAILAAWGNLNVPSRLVLGNHDYYVPATDTDGVIKPANVYRKFGFGTEAYYHYLYNGFRFVVLEGDNSYLNYKTGTTEHTNALAYYNDMSSSSSAKKWWNAGISITQRLWLLEQLDESYRINEPVIIMCHYPVHTPISGHSLLNSTQLLNICDGYDNVVMWINGHDHSGDYLKMGDRHHLGLKGLQSGADSWYEMRFTPTNVKVYKDTDLTNTEYDLDITIPLANIIAPTGVSMTDSTISWSTEPTNATEIIIQRRHKSPLIYELPSTASSLAWGDITTIQVYVSTQQYTDSPPNAISQYEYRIRFGDGGSGLSKYTKV